MRGARAWCDRREPAARAKTVDAAIGTGIADPAFPRRRQETAEQRADRNFHELLQELRVAQIAPAATTG